MEEPLGIQSYGYEYMELSPNQEGLENSLIEFKEIIDFLVKVINSNRMQEFQGNKKLQFINYGDTELVYVLNVNGKYYTMLMGQPAVEFGTVKREYENLKLLGRNNRENVVVPMQYFKDKNNKREVYITPYLYQARCIGIEDKKLGTWIPEPKYHFKEFSQAERSIINSNMIAILIKLFDDKNNLGIGDCELGGGDFVLEKGYENETFTHDNILRRMKLIAARNLLPMSLDEYVRTLRKEFVKNTYYKTGEKSDKSILVNRKLKTPMSIEEIEQGIELGYELRKRQKDKNEKY